MTPPLIFYNSILQFAEGRLYEQGAIYVEIHEDLGSAVSDLFSAADRKSVV